MNSDLIPSGTTDMYAHDWMTCFNRPGKMEAVFSQQLDDVEGIHDVLSDPPLDTPMLVSALLKPEISIDG